MHSDDAGPWRVTPLGPHARGAREVTIKLGQRGHLRIEMLTTALAHHVHCRGVLFVHEDVVKLEPANFFIFYVAAPAPAQESS